MSTALCRYVWKRLFPALHLFRAFRLALDYRKLALAFFGLAIFTAGQRLIVQLPFAPEQGETKVASDTSLLGSIHRTKESLDSFTDVQENPWNLVKHTTRHVSELTAPAEIVTRPASLLFERRPLPPEKGGEWARMAYLWTQLLWALSVWAAVSNSQAFGSWFGATFEGPFAAGAPYVALAAP